MEIIKKYYETKKKLDELRDKEQSQTSYYKNYYKRNREAKKEYGKLYRIAYYAKNKEEMNKVSKKYMQEARKKNTYLNIIRWNLKGRDVKEYMIFNSRDMNSLKELNNGVMFWEKVIDV